MAHLEETDNTTKNIVHEIVRVCYQQKLEIDALFCTYYVKLLTLDPVWKISPERKIDRNNIQVLVSFIIKMLQLTENASIATLKMQQYFLTNCVDKSNIIKALKTTISNCILPLEENIKKFVLDDTNKWKLYKRLVIYISLKSKLGDPRHGLLMKDTFYALKSVMKEDDLIAFSKKKPQEKVTYLNYLKNVVMGIQLFNRHCAKTTVEIKDLPKVIVDNLPLLQYEVHTKLYHVMQKVNLITAAIENVYEPTTEFQKNSKKFIHFMKLTLPEEVTKEDVSNYIDFLALFRQNESFLRILIKELDEVEKNIYELINQLDELLLKLEEIVKYNMAISVSIIFPMFEELAEIWIKVQNECVVSTLYTETFTKLNGFYSNENLDEDKLQIMIGNKIIITDIWQMTEIITPSKKIEQSQIGSCKLHFPLDMKNFKEITFEHSGYCIWSLVETNGALLSGNPYMGIVEWEEKYYIFYAVEGAQVFAEDPVKLINAMLNLTRKSPHLINILQVYELLINARNIEELIELKEPEIIKIDQTIQTELHLAPTNIVPNYVWNEWDLYRDAIQLANISKCKTNSMQTLNSQFRSSIQVQTTEPRDKICQTKTDNYTNVATPQNFLFGLRGRTDDVQHIIDLTRPVDEDHFWTCATANPNPPSCVMKTKKCMKYKTKSRASTMSLPKIKIDDVDISFGEDSGDLGSCICVIELDSNISQQI